MTEELVAAAAAVVVVAIVTAIQEIIMTQGEIMIPVVITTLRGMVILHQVTVLVVVELWIKNLTDQEV